MSTVHASAAPAHAAAQGHPARSPATAAAAAPDDLFAQLLAGLQADGEPTAAVTTQEPATDDAATPEDLPPRGDPAAEPPPLLALLGVVAGSPAPAAPDGNGASADPAGPGEGSGAPLSTAATANEDGAGRALSPAADAVQANDGGVGRGEATAPSPRAKARDKSAARPGGTGSAAAALQAPRSEAAWAALQEAAGHAGQAHGLRALASAAPADTSAVNPAPAAQGGATPTVATDAGSGQPSSGGQAGQAALPANASSEPAAAAAEAALEAAFGQQLQEALQQTLDGLGAQVALWQAGRQQRASLTFEDGWDEPLAVDLNVEQGVAHLSFRTDDATARQLIQTQAPQALAEALARAGLALGQVDVGARGQQGDAPAEPPRRALRLAAGVGAGVGGAAASRAGQPAARGVLDLYA
ncbi:Flagellar hook-length control protein FliK [Tepidimonas sediminis]|uniref:Flagellar hook-length control protein FliK n=1 Tax=Tepidimonas sediminis TaxID=2588941 RepID=A0A554WNP9_9BURK|nr:flagellar hook-length control protein FliK [Tepidimonas sediminis]TSE25197.1 Flagellar hook-length control protein FliK [Tepidimonas sediminis]